MRQLSLAAQRARHLKANNRKVEVHKVKRAPKGWADFQGAQEAGLPVDDLDALSPASREKLKRQAQEELLYRIRGNKEAVKLSQTFEEAATDLGFSNAADRQALLSVVFAHAMDRYRTPSTNKPLSELRHSVFQVLMEEDHTSPFEIRVHDPENWARRSNGSFTSRISELGHLDRINEPVSIHTHQEDDDEHINGVPFTYYYLTEEFKKQFIKDAVAWDAEREAPVLSLDIHERIATLG